MLLLNYISTRHRFQRQYGVRARTALPYAMNSEFSRIMETQMVECLIVLLKRCLLFVNCKDVLLDFKCYTFANSFLGAIYYS